MYCLLSLFTALLDCNECANGQKADPSRHFVTPPAKSMGWTLLKQL